MRKPRKPSPADIYHAVARGTGRQLIFEDDEDRLMFLSLLKKSLDKTNAELYAWCLMGNHVHLLIHAPLERLSNCMKLLLGSYSQWFNEKTGRVGHLFQGRFISEPVDTDSYLITVIRYIHANPEKAGLSKTEAYLWSSYSEYAGKPNLCKTDFVLKIFGSAEEFIRTSALEDNYAHCLDIPTAVRPRQTYSDEKILAASQSLLGFNPNKLKTLPKQDRDHGLVALKEAGLSVRQIERITGIGKSTISRA